MLPKSLPLQQCLEGVLSIGEKTFKVASLVKAAQEDLAKKEELNRLFIAALRSSGILPAENLISIASSFLPPIPIPPGSEEKLEKLLQETKWFDQGLTCQLLVPGKKEWEKGRVRLRITVEFEPERTSSESSDGSPLDDLRTDKE
ncbi:MULTISPECIES: KGK domain-containing protein [unclassified Synechococcus]|uniref:KGK domain-containing protein n=1 Tax=unclassified Synechococcus TaxID=2626047 RepID=UPI0039C186D8